MMTNELKPRPAALPASYEDMIAGRQTQLTLSLNDHIDDLHLMLWKEDQQKYMRLIEAVWDEDCQEGSCTADDIMLAMMLRQKASDIGNSHVAGKKLATISKAHRVVLKRYGLSRRQRREHVKGEAVSGNGD